MGFWSLLTPSGRRLTRRVIAMPNAKSLTVLQDPPPPPRQNRRLHMLVLIALAWLAIVFAFTSVPRGDGTSGDLPAIHIAPVIVAEPRTETPVALQLGPSESIPSDGWVRIGGLPALATLSEGYVTQLGVWKVPISGLPTLKLRAPQTEGCKSEIAIALLTADGVVLTEARSVLAVTPTWHDLHARCALETARPSHPAPVWPFAEPDAMHKGDEALATGSIQSRDTITSMPHGWAGRRLPLRWQRPTIHTSLLVFSRPSSRTPGRTSKRRARGIYVRRNWPTLG